MKFRARRAAILRPLRDAPQTLFDLMVEIFGTLPIQEVFLGVTEVLGHLDVLTGEGAVAAEEKGGRLVFALAPP